MFFSLLFAVKSLDFSHAGLIIADSVPAFKGVAAIHTNDNVECTIIGHDIYGIETVRLTYGHISTIEMIDDENGFSLVYPKNRAVRGCIVSSYGGADHESGYQELYSARAKAALDNQIAYAFVRGKDVKTPAGNDFVRKHSTLLKELAQGVCQVCNYVKGRLANQIQWVENPTFIFHGHSFGGNLGAAILAIDQWQDCEGLASRLPESAFWAFDGLYLTAPSLLSEEEQLVRLYESSQSRLQFWEKEPQTSIGGISFKVDDLLSRVNRPVSLVYAGSDGRVPVCNLLKLKDKKFPENLFIDWEPGKSHFDLSGDLGPFFAYCEALKNGNSKEKELKKCLQQLTKNQMQKLSTFPSDSLEFYCLITKGNNKSRLTDLYSKPTDYYHFVSSLCQTEAWENTFTSAFERFNYEAWQIRRIVEDKKKEMHKHVQKEPIKLTGQSALVVENRSADVINFLVNQTFDKEQKKLLDIWSRVDSDSEDENIAEKFTPPTMEEIQSSIREIYQKKFETFFSIRESAYAAVAGLDDEIADTRQQLIEFSVV